MNPEYEKIMREEDYIDLNCNACGKRTAWIKMKDVTSRQTIRCEECIENLLSEWLDA